jgi:hypothetical protein
VDYVDLLRKILSILSRGWLWITVDTVDKGNKGGFKADVSE